MIMTKLSDPDYHFRIGNSFNILQITGEKSLSTSTKEFSHVRRKINSSFHHFYSMKATVTTTGHLPAPALHSISASGGAQSLYSSNNALCEGGLLSIINEGNYVSILDIVAADLLELTVTPTFNILPFNSNLHTLCHCWVPFIFDSQSNRSGGGGDGTSPVISSSSSLSSSPSTGAAVAAKQPPNLSAYAQPQNLLIIGQDRQILLYTSPYTKPIGEINVYFEIKTMAAITLRYHDIMTTVNGSSSYSSSSASLFSSSPSSNGTPMTDENMKIEGDDDSLSSSASSSASNKDLVLIAIGGVNGVQLHFWSPSLGNSTGNSNSSTHPQPPVSVTVPSSLPWPVMEMLPGYLISHITFSPSGKLLSIIAYDGHVGLWDVAALLTENYRIREQRITEVRKKLRNNAKLHIQHTHSILKSQGFATAFQSGKHGKHHGKGKTGLGKYGKLNPNTNTISTIPTVSTSSSLNDTVCTSIPAVAHGVIRDGRITAVTISENDRFLALALHDGRVVVYGRCDERRDIQWLHNVEGAPDSLVGNNYSFTTANTTSNGTVGTMAGTNGTTNTNGASSVSTPLPLSSSSTGSNDNVNSNPVSSSSAVSSFSSRLRNLQNNYPSRTNNGITNTVNTSNSNSGNTVSSSLSMNLPRRWALSSSSPFSSTSAHDVTNTTLSTTNPPLPPGNPPPPPLPSVGPVYRPQWWPPILAIDHTGAIAPMLGICDRPRTTTFTSINTGNTTNFSNLTNHHGGNSSVLNASEDEFTIDLKNHILPGIDNCIDTMSSNGNKGDSNTVSTIHGPTLLAFLPSAFLSSSIYSSSGYRSYNHANDNRTGTLVIGNSRSQNVYTLTIHPFTENSSSSTNNTYSSSSVALSSPSFTGTIHSPFHKMRSNSEQYSPSSETRTPTQNNGTSGGGNNNFTFTPGRQSNGLLSMHNTGIIQRSSSLSSTSSSSSSSSQTSLSARRIHHPNSMEENSLVASTLNYLSNDHPSYSSSSNTGISLMMPSQYSQHRTVLATPTIDMVSPTLTSKSKYTFGQTNTNVNELNDPSLLRGTATNNLSFTAGSLSSIKRLRMEEDEDSVTNNMDSNVSSVDELVHNQTTPFTSYLSRSSLSTNSNERNPAEHPNHNYGMQMGTVTKIPAMEDPVIQNNPLNRPRTPATNVPLYSATPLGVLSIGNNITGLNVVAGRSSPVGSMSGMGGSGSKPRSTSIHPPSIVRVAVIDSFGGMYILSPRLSGTKAMDGTPGGGLSNRTSPGGGGSYSSSPTISTGIQLSFASPKSVVPTSGEKGVFVRSPEESGNNRYGNETTDTNGWLSIPCSKNYHLTITDALATLINAQQTQTERLIRSIMNNGNGSSHGGNSGSKR